MPEHPDLPNQPNPTPVKIEEEIKREIYRTLALYVHPATTVTQMRSATLQIYARLGPYLRRFGS